MGYIVVILGIPAFLVLLYGLGEVGSYNFSFFRQPMFLLQCLLLTAAFIGVFWRKIKASGLLEKNIRFRIFMIVLIFFISSAALSLVNKLWIVRSFERSAAVLSKEIRSPWGEKGKQSRPPVCTVEVASGINPERRIVGLLDCEIWHRLDASAGVVQVRTRIGITGLEFSKILKIDTAMMPRDVPLMVGDGNRPPPLGGVPVPPPPPPGEKPQ